MTQSFVYFIVQYSLYVTGFQKACRNCYGFFRLNWISVAHCIPKEILNPDIKVRSNTKILLSILKEQCSCWADSFCFNQSRIHLLVFLWKVRNFLTIFTTIWNYSRKLLGHHPICWTWSLLYSQQFLIFLQFLKEAG